MDGAGLLAKVEDPDAGPATSMLQVLVVPAPRPSGGHEVVRLKLVGELCAHSAGRVEPAMRRFVEHADSVVIDLSELRFIDAAGLRLFNGLVDGQDAMRFEHVDTRLTRIFEIAGLDRLLRNGRARAAS